MTRTVAIAGYPGGPFELEAHEPLAVVADRLGTGVIATLSPDRLGLPELGVDADWLADLPYADLGDLVVDLPGGGRLIVPAELRRHVEIVQVRPEPEHRCTATLDGQRCALRAGHDSPHAAHPMLDDDGEPVDLPPRPGSHVVRDSYGELVVTTDPPPVSELPRRCPALTITPAGPVRCTRPSGHSGSHGHADVVGFTW